MSFKLSIKEKLSRIRFVLFIWTIYKEIKLYTITRKRITIGKKSKKNIIYYCGIPAHGNLGDLAQGVCIRRWLKKHYPSFAVTEIETNALVNTHFSVLKFLKKSFNEKDDFVVFQSGYTTTDLGGYANIMHQAVMKAIPDARILMMPQTIFFQTEERKKECSLVYNEHRKMLFLARDQVSYKMANEMFPNIPQRCYPDIVTTMIGTRKYTGDREGIIFCLRDDGEKYYSDEELNELIRKCESISSVRRTDTTKNKDIIKDPEKHIDREIEYYSKFKIMVTDRYHGTILSLVAGTPVVIIRTNDHKVITGADWFVGVYDDYVYVATDLNEAFELIKEIYNRKYENNMTSYFEQKYYDNLPAEFKMLVP